MFYPNLDEYHHKSIDEINQKLNDFYKKRLIAYRLGKTDLQVNLENAIQQLLGILEEKQAEQYTKKLKDEGIDPYAPTDFTR